MIFTNDMIKNISYFTLHVPVILKIYDLLESKTLNYKAIAQHIHLDVGIYFLLLKSYYQHNNTGSMPTTEKILLDLGLPAFKKLLLESMKNGFPAKTNRLFETNQGQILIHSYSAMVITDKIIKRLPGLSDPLAKSGALLHDIGKLIMSELLLRTNRHVSSKIIPNSDKIKKLQKELSKIRHDEIGSQFLENLGFPTPIVEIVRYHHSYKDKPENLELLAVSLANEISNLIGFTTFRHTDEASDLVFLLDHLKLSELEGELIIAESTEKIQNFIQLCLSQDNHEEDDHQEIESQLLNSDNPYEKIFGKYDKTDNNPQ